MHKLQLLDQAMSSIKKKALLPIAKERKKNVPDNNAL